MTFAEALRRTMEEENLTKTDVAHSGGVSEGAVRKYLDRRAEPRRPVYDKLRRAYPSLAKRMDDAVVA